MTTALSLNKLRLLVTLLSALWITGCAYSQASPAPTDSKANQKIANTKRPASVETIYGMTLTESGIQFDVMSNGCTKAKDFVLSKRVVSEGLIEITLKRIKPDYCKAKPRIMTIVKKLPELNNNPRLKVKVINPFRLLPNFKRSK